MAACCLRLISAFNGPDIEQSLWSDMEIYYGISTQIMKGSWSANHFFQSIGYPLFLVALRNVFIKISDPLIIIQVSASIISLLLLFRTAAESLGLKIGIVSLIIGATHLPWILYNNYALPESLFTMLLSLLAWFSWKILKSAYPSFIDGILWGGTFTAAFWLKGTHAFFGPLFLASLWIFKKHTSERTVIGICVVVSLGLMAHALLSYKTIGKVQLSASTGGLNFIEGKCPDKVNMDTEGYRWQSPLYYQLELNSMKTWDRPFTESSYFVKKGFECIKKDPFVLIQSLESIPYLFLGNTMWPFNRTPMAKYTRLYELLFAVFLIVGLTQYFVLILKSKVTLEEFILWTIPVFSLFLCVYIFKSEIRYRVPFDIWFIPIGVKGWSTLLASKK